MNLQLYPKLSPTLLDLICLFHIFLPLMVSGQEDNFDDGNDGGWTRFNPLRSATFTVVDGAYRLHCPASPNQATFGPARAGALQLERVRTDFCMAVDLVNWNPEQDGSMGLLARIQPEPEAGALNGYAFTYQARDNDLEINRVVNEVPTRLATIDVSLDPLKDYRMVLIGIEGYLEGRVYDLTNLMTPLATCVVQSDDTYENGATGLVIFSDSNTPVTVSFDNFSSSIPTPPPILVALLPRQEGASLGEVKIEWNALRGLCFTLETSGNLRQWSTLEPSSILGTTASYTEVVSTRLRGFYRLALRKQPSP